MNIEIPNLVEVINFLKHQFLNNQFFSTAGVFGILGVVFNYTKSVPIAAYKRIKRKVVYEVLVDMNSTMYQYLEAWFRKNHATVYRNTTATTDLSLKREDEYDVYAYLGEEEDSSYSDGFKEKLSERIIYRHSEDIFYLRRGLNFIRVEKSRDKLENASSTKDPFYHSFILKSLFSKTVINKVLEEALQDHIQELKNSNKEQVELFTNAGHRWEKEKTIDFKPLDKIKSKNKKIVIEDLNNFIEDRSWYKKRAIPYKRGILFYGEPGTGKTSLAIAIANHFRRPIYILNPQNVTDEDLRGLFRKLRNNSILLIEDIDAYFLERNSKLMFNFSTFLNCLDGVYAKEGVITIFTSNKPENLDTALIREGRIDLKIQMTYPDKEEIEEYLESFYEDKILVNIETNKKLSMAFIQEVCLQNKTNARQTVNQIENLCQKT